MNNEILDDFKEFEIDNKQTVIRIFQIFFASIVLFFVIEELREFLPVNLLDWNDIQIKTIGLIIMVVYFIDSILLPDCLNKIKPKLNKIKVVVYTGVVLSTITLIFRFTQSFINGYGLDFLSTIESSVIISIMGMLIANIRIHKIRGENTFIPNLLLIAIWIIAGIIMNNINRY